MLRGLTCSWRPRWPAPPRAAGPPSAQLLGRSWEGRAIEVARAGDPRSSHRVLVVGCIHGDGCAGMAVTQRLMNSSRLEWPRGAATRWQNGLDQRSFVVELPPGPLTGARADRYAEALLRLADPLCCGR